MSEHSSLFLHVIGVRVNQSMFGILSEVNLFEELVLPLPPAEYLLALLPILIAFLLLTALPCLLLALRSLHLLFHVPDDLSVALCLLTGHHQLAPSVDPELLQLLLDGLLLLLHACGSTSPGDRSLESGDGPFKEASFHNES